MTDQSLKGKRVPILDAQRAEVFWRKVDRSGGPDACWPWRLSVDKTTGYGQLNWQILGGVRKVHTVAWEIGNDREIPRDPATGRRLDIDHLCHNRDTSCHGGTSCPHRLCCNPAHLQPKSTGHNKDAADYPRKRGIFREECRYGHEFTEENTLWTHRSKPRPGKERIRASEKRCRICEYTKMCKNPDCSSEQHDHGGTPWPKGNYALILAARVTGNSAS